MSVVGSDNGMVTGTHSERPTIRSAPAAKEPQCGGNLKDKGFAINFNSLSKKDLKK